MKSIKSHSCFTSLVVLIPLFAFFTISLAQTYAQNTSNENLLHQYIQEKGNNVITFDSSNIKMFWTDRSVLKQDNSFKILLNKKTKFESIPLHIQLANVKETQDCSIEVITDTPDIAFSVLNAKGKTVSSSTAKKSFIQHSILSSMFHLDETVFEDNVSYSFDLVFSSSISIEINIKAIILSFSQNKDSHFLLSPGESSVNLKNVSDQTLLSKENKDSFKVKGYYRRLMTKESFYVSENPLKASASLKNIGDVPLTIYFSYVLYSPKHNIVKRRNYPYKGINNILKVVSAEKGSDKIIVDAYPQWEKECYIALDAKDDLSDIPNEKLLNGRVVNIRKIDDHSTEISLDQKLDFSIEKGMGIRIHEANKQSSPLIAKKINPGEEFVLESIIKKGNATSEYSSSSIPMGVYYIKPVLICASNSDSTSYSLLISNFIVSY